MKIRARLLIISLLALVSCCTTARAQQPGTVNIRQGTACAQPGLPEVRVTADRHRVPLGEIVTFTLAPASGVWDRGFTATFYFGDDSPPEMHPVPDVFRHLYNAPKTYVYSTCVKPVPGPPKPPKPEVPSVKLIANPTTVTTGNLVNFAAELSRHYPNIRYRFVLGDGAQTKWQDAAQTSHPYAAAGTYQAFVDIGESSGGLTTRLGGSPRQRIQVTAPPIVRVDLLANQASAKTGDTVRFSARTNSRDPKIKYRFAFGDGALTSWQDSSGTNHKYVVANDYFASVEVGLPSNRTTETVATSKRVKIGVAMRPAPPTPTPSPRPSPGPSPTPSVSPPPSPSPSVSPTSSPSPSASPTPSPSPSVSPTSSPSVSPPPSPSPSVSPPPGGREVGGRGDGAWPPWWIYPLLALPLLYFLLPRPKFVPNLDRGVSRVGVGKPLSIDLELVLDPNVTGGQYGIETHEGSLIKSERENNG